MTPTGKRTRDEAHAQPTSNVTPDLLRGRGFGAQPSVDTGPAARHELPCGRRRLVDSPQAAMPLTTDDQLPTVWRCGVCANSHSQINTTSNHMECTRATNTRASAENLHTATDVVPPHKSKREHSTAFGTGPRLETRGSLHTGDVQTTKHCLVR